MRPDDTAHLLSSMANAERLRVSIRELSGGPDLSPFSQVLFMEAAKGLNRKASAKFARYQNRIGRPVPRSATDRRPDPGTLDNEDCAVEVEG